MSRIKSIKDIDCSGKRVFVRCDFNVPFANNEISDDSRIVAALPTIRYLIAQDAKIILSSHLGRPKGEKKVEYERRRCSCFGERSFLQGRNE